MANSPRVPKSARHPRPSSARGFTLAAGVYVFRLDRYRPILRATILTAFLGYLMAIVSLMFDIGQPWRIWHPMVMWNDHSAMFEVALCVMMYITVLALEFSPAVFEWLKLERPLRIIHMLTPPLVIIGVLLSTLHQSTLGTLFVIVPGKVHGLWYTQFLPVLFYISAIGCGMIAFALIVRHMPILPAHEREEEEAEADPHSHGDYAPLTEVVPAPPGSALPRMATPMGLAVLAGPAALFIVFGYAIEPSASPKPRPEDERASAFLASSTRKLDLADRTTDLKLPGEYTFKMGSLSSGKVIFSHKRHVAHGDEACTNCHPKLYPMQRPGSDAAKFHGNERMYGCASCHNGMRAFDVERECALCHGGDGGKVAVPDDFLIASHSNGVGPVEFSPKSHVLRALAKCSDCHPKPYEMAAPGTTFGKIRDLSKRMERGHACAKCHDGHKTFSVGPDCTRCHIERGGAVLEMTSNIPGH